MDCSPPGSSVHGNPRREYWYLCPPPGDVPDLGIEPRSPALQVKSLPSESPGVLVEKTPLPVQETQETWVRSLGLEKEMATDSSILAWRIPLIDCSPPDPSVHGTFQARTLDWVAISLSKRNYRKKESEVTELSLTLCDPVDCILPGSSIHGISQARTLEWVAISFSNA